MSNSPVIAFVSPKGGAGKTTAALTLASELIHQMKKPITVIDADPNYPFKRWASLNRKPELLKIVLDESENTILDNIENAKKASKAVIIDLEGTKNMRVTYAVSKADLVVIPVQGSILDANEAAEAIKLIKQTEKGFGRKIDFGILFTKLPAAIVTKNFADIARQFSDAGIPVLSTRLMEREAFRTMFSTGKCLYDLSDSQVGGLNKAKEDSFAFAEAVVSRINSTRQKSSHKAA